MKDKNTEIEQVEMLAQFTEWETKIKGMTREQIEEAILLELSEIRGDLRKWVENIKSSEQLKNEKS